MKMKKEAKGSGKSRLVLILIFFVMFFFAFGSATTAAETFYCDIIAQDAGQSVLLARATGTDADSCTVSCFDGTGQLTEACKRPTLAGWPNAVNVQVRYYAPYGFRGGYRDPTNNYALQSTQLGQSWNVDGQQSNGIIVNTKFDFSAYADSDLYKAACQAQVANSQWGPTYGNKDATSSRCCGSDGTPSGYVSSATFPGVSGAFSYLCAEDAGRNLWVGSSNENAGKVYVIDEGTPGQYDAVVRESLGFYSCKNSGVASTASKIDVGNKVPITKYSTKHEFMCDDFGRFLECKKASDSFFNTVSANSRTFSPGEIAAISQKNFLCYDGTWHDLAAITPQTVTSKALCEVVIGDTPSMGWIGDKDTGQTSCCFKDGQYFGNSVNGKGCWNGRVINNGEIVSGTSNKVLNEKGKFQYCAGNGKTIAVNYNLEDATYVNSPYEFDNAKYLPVPTFKGNSYVAMPIKPSKSMTISVWATSTTPPANMGNMLWRMGTAGQYNGLDLYFLWGYMYLNNYDGAGDPFYCAIPSNVGSWHNYAAVLDGDNSPQTAKMYVDGKLCGTANYYKNPVQYAPYDNFILSGGGGSEWSGRMNDAVVYNKALSADEVNDLYSISMISQSLNPACMLKSSYYCGRSGEWTQSRNQVASEVTGEINSKKTAPSDYKSSEAGFSEFNCCPASSCWDGFTCAPPDVKQKGRVLANGQFITDSYETTSLQTTLKTGTKEYACVQAVNSRDNSNVGSAYWSSLDALNLLKSESLCKIKYPLGNPEDRGWTGTTCCFKSGQYYSEAPSCTVQKILGKNQEICTPDLSKVIGGCWDGKIIPKETRLPGDPRAFVDRMGKFRYCNGTNSKFPDGTSMILTSACTTFNSTEENVEQVFCEPKATNKQAGEWKETLDHVDGKTTISKLSPTPSSLPAGVSASDVGTSYPAQCCPADYCWNGNKCVTSGSDGEQNMLTANGKNFRCVKGKWSSASFKYDWDNENKGVCNEETSCYVKQRPGNVGSEQNMVPYLYTSATPPKCLLGASSRLDFTYIGDHLCEKGNWTTRTKFVALKLINYTQKQKSNDFVLMCGRYSDVLNVYDFPIATTVYDNKGKPVQQTEGAEKIFSVSEVKPNKRKYAGNEISECYGQDCVNNICVLKLKEGAAEKVIMGASLNQEVYDFTGQNNNFLAAFYRDTGISLAGCDSSVSEMKRLIAYGGAAGSTGKYTSCGTQKLWYNPQMRIMVYSKDPFVLDEPGLVDFLNSPLNALRELFSKAFASGNVASIEASQIVDAQNFDTLFYAKSGGREVRGIVENKLVGPDYDKRSYVTMSLEYIGFTNDLCSEIQKQTSQDLEFMQLPIKCRKEGPKTFVNAVTPYSEFSAEAMNNLWNELIKIKV